jgi:hypothetical protein
MPSGLNRVRAQMLLFFAMLNSNQNRANLWGFRWWYMKNYSLIPLLDLLTFRRLKWTVQRFDEHDLDDFQSLYASFFFDDETPFVLQKMKFIRQQLRWFVGPRAACADIAFRQYRECEVALKGFDTVKLMQSSETQRKKLVQLMSWLYLPWWSKYAFKKYALSYEATAKRAVRFSKLTDSTLYAVYLFYAGSRQYFRKHFSSVFQKENADFDELQPKRKKETDIEQQLLDMLHIRSGNVTNDTETDLSNVYDVLGHFQTEARQAAAIKEEYERNKT